MNGDEDLDLNEAYAVETPDDNRNLYGRWATTYESGFATRHAYVYHERVAATFTESVGPDDDVRDRRRFQAHSEMKVDTRIQAQSVKLLEKKLSRNY